MQRVRHLGWVFILACLGGGLALAEPLTFSGKVVDAAGNPVADARVSGMVYQAERGFNLVTATTDANGAFTFQGETPPRDTGPVRVRALASKPGLALALGELTAGTPLTLKLGDKPETRSGVVLKPDGQPFAGATVQSQYVTLGGQTSPSVISSSFPVKATTDAQGRFQFEGFPAGMTLNLTVQADGCADAEIRLADANPATVTLTPEATISGKVLANGQPQAGIYVSAYNYGPGRRIAPAGLQTAADGTYTLRRVGAGTVTVSATAPRGMAPCAEQSVNTKPGQAVTGIDFSFTPGALIRGKVTDEKTGQPVAQANVSVSTAEGGRGSYAQSDAEGKYEARVRPGAYRVNAQTRGGPGVMVTSRGGNQFPGATEVTVKEDDVLEGQDLKVRLPRTVKGQVLLPDGQPATGAQVLTMGGFGGRPTVELGAEARFELTVPEITTPPGGPGMSSPTMLLATEPKLNMAALYSKDPLPDEFTITLQPAATVTLVITDQENHPLPGFGVSVGYPYGERGSISQGSVKSDALGLIRLTCLPPGLKLRLFPDQMLRQLMVSEERRELEVTLQPGEEKTLPPIVVNPDGRSLNVFVGDADGKPVQGAQVYAPGLNTPALTGADGKVAVSKLPLRGKVLLVAMHPAQEWFGTESVDPDAGVWPGLLLKPLGKATGVLANKADGKPLEGVQVRCQAGAEMWRMGGEVQQRLMRWMYGQPAQKTDAQGRWRVENLIPGVEYHLFATSADGRAFGRPGNTFKAAGGDAEQDVGIMEVDAPEGQ